VSDNVEKRFELDIYIELLRMWHSSQRWSQCLVLMKNIWICVMCVQECYTVNT